MVWMVIIIPIMVITTQILNAIPFEIMPIELYDFLWNITFWTLMIDAMVLYVTIVVYLIVDYAAIKLVKPKG